MQSHTIAIIEDDRALSKVLTDGLTAAGFKVVQGFDGTEGLAVTESEKPDLILLDITMPKMDGITMLRELRKKELNGIQTPVLVLTNILEMDQIAEATELGAVGYLQKTEWHLDDVTKKIQEILGATS